MVEGKGVLRKKGSVSFFLQDMAEYKKSLQVKQGVVKKKRGGLHEEPNLS